MKFGVTRFCKICGKTKGGPTNHSECSKLLQKKMQKTVRKQIQKRNDESA